MENMFNLFKKDLKNLAQTIRESEELRRATIYDYLQKKCISCGNKKTEHCENTLCHPCWLEETIDY